MKLRLSEAIRLGSMVHPQAFGHLFHEGATCAMGAAGVAIGGIDAQTGQLNTDVLPVTAWEWTINSTVLCPLCGDRFETVYGYNAQGVIYPSQQRPPVVTRAHR